MDKDVFDSMRVYQLEPDYISKLTRVYIKIIIANKSKYSLSLKFKLVHLFSIYIKMPYEQNEESIWKHSGIIGILVEFILDNVKHEDKIIDSKWFVLVLKTILLQITHINHYKQNSLFKRLLKNLKTVLQLLYIFDRVSLVIFIDYFAVTMLDTFIYIYNTVGFLKSCMSETINVIINIIFKLNNHRGEILLAKFRKWFVLIVREYVTSSVSYSESPCERSYEAEFCLRIYSSDWFAKGETMGNMFIEVLPWFSKEHSGVENFLSYIGKNNELFSHTNESFFNNERLYLANKLLSNIRYNKRDVIIPSWYCQLLDKMEHEGSVDMRKGIENLVQMYLRSYIDRN